LLAEGNIWSDLLFSKETLSLSILEDVWEISRGVEPLELVFLDFGASLFFFEEFYRSQNVTH